MKFLDGYMYFLSLIRHSDKRGCRFVTQPSIDCQTVQITAHLINIPPHHLQFINNVINLLLRGCILFRRILLRLLHDPFILTIVNLFQLQLDSFR